MCHVAAEMERQGFEVPLLIGGATTSRVHTAVKIHPNYQRGQAVYVNDASRAVGVAQALMSAENKAGYVSELRGEYSKLAAAHARAQADKQRMSLGRRARQCAQARLVGRLCCRRSRRFLGTQGAGRLSGRRIDRLHRLDAVLSDLGIAGQIPRHSRRCEIRAGRALAVRRRARHARQDRGRALVHGQRGGRLLAGEQRGRRHPGVRRRGAQRADRHAAHAAPAAHQARGPLQPGALPISLRRATAGSPTISAPSPSPPASARTRWPTASSAPTTTTPPSWSRRWPIGWPKRFAERLHQRVRKEFWGYAPDEALTSDRTDRREISRHPPGARLSGAARPHRERRRCSSCCEAERDRRQADRKLRDVAGRFGVRALFQPSRRAPISASARSSATRSRITPSARAGAIVECEKLAGADPQLRCAHGEADRGGVITDCRCRNPTPRAPETIARSMRFEPAAGISLHRLWDRACRPA